MTIVRNACAGVSDDPPGCEAQTDRTGNTLFPVTASRRPCTRPSPGRRMLTFTLDLIVPGVGRLLSVTHLSASSVATAQPGFTYGATGNVTRITDAAGHVRPYESTYEKEGRSPGNAHLRGAVFDIRYPGDAERALCCAALH